MGDLSKSAQCVRILLIVINIIFFIIGVIVFALGIYLIVEEGDLSFITDNNVIGGAALFIIVGSVAMVITVFCILGAIFKWRPILFLYALIVTIIVILQIVAAILGFVFSDNVSGFVDEQVQDAISRYRAENDTAVENDVNRAVDFIQETFGCCGYDSANDWFIFNPDYVELFGRPPLSCSAVGCDATAPDCATYTNVTVGVSFNATTEGCRGDTENALRVFGYTLGGVGIAFAVIEILGILFSLCFCCCITQARKQTVV